MKLFKTWDMIKHTKKKKGNNCDQEVRNVSQTPYFFRRNFQPFLKDQSKPLTPTNLWKSLWITFRTWARTLQTLKTPQRDT